LPRLSETLDGPKLLVKRDDQTGLAFGGNKARKLELLLPEALANGARTLLTRGALQSNHCRQTAAAAARCGLGCILVLSGDPPATSSGNILLDRLLGGELVWTRGREPEGALQEAFEQARADGRFPYLIPYGGSSPLGAAAYAEAMRELLEQEVDIDVIVLATSSGGTQAGLLAGARLHGYRGRIIGISVDQSASMLQTHIAALAQEVGDVLGEKVDVSADEVEVDDRFCEAGYAVLGEREREAIALFARTEGLLLDPVYTGRAAGGMVDLIRRGSLGSSERVLFWHTGGTPALFAYGEALLASVRE
jgi:D-cysteine desulfhydrase family pyridoxal phosphate-dependent enzyme